MSRAPRQWSLPGPTAFVRAVAQIANDDGIAAVIAPPHCLPQLDAALEGALCQPWLPTLNAQLDEPPLTALSRALDVDTLSASALPTDRVAEGKAVVVEGLDPRSWSRWKRRCGLGPLAAPGVSVSALSSLPLSPRTARPQSSQLVRDPCVGRT